MTARNYDACLAITLDYEGGYSNDAGDPGGPTKYGITIADVRMYLNPKATAQDVKNLTLEQAKKIYFEHYWNPVQGNLWPEGLDLSVFDAGVNSGLGRAKPWAQKALGSTIDTFTGLANSSYKLTSEQQVAAIKKYNAVRLSFLHALRTWSIFGRGWGSRVAGIESLGVKMALKAANLTAAEQKKKLEDEAATAKGQKTANGGGAGAVTVGGGGASKLPWADFGPLEWGVAIVCSAIVLIAILVLVRGAILHHQRQLAYTAAAKTV